MRRTWVLIAFAAVVSEAIPMSSLLHLRESLQQMSLNRSWRSTMGHSDMAWIVTQPGVFGLALGGDCDWVVDYESTDDPHSMRKWVDGL